MPHASSDDSGELATRDRSPLPRLGAKWWDKDLDDDLTRLLNSLLKPDEQVIGLLSAQPARDEVDATWLCVTSGRSLLLERRTTGALQPLELPPEELTRKESTIGRDDFGLGDEVLWRSPLVGRGALRTLSELAHMPAPLRVIKAATLHEDDALWADAADLWRRADELLCAEDAPADALESDDALDFEVAESAATHRADASASAPLTPHQRAILGRAQSAHAVGDHGEAITHLSRLTQRRPKDDLIETTRAIVGDRLAWWMVVAVAHEEAHDHTAAAAVYTHLAHHEDSDALFWLAAARSHVQEDAAPEALDAYQRFIDARVADDDFRLISLMMEEVDDLAEASADPDLVDACLEAGRLAEETAQWDVAAKIYLTQIRQAPFRPEGYAHLFALRDRLKDEPHATALLGQAAAILRLLNPRRAEEVADSLKHGLPRTHTPTDLPPVFSAHLKEDAHDDVITHEGERESTSMAQKWVGDLIADVPSTKDIERHCQQVQPRTHPDLAEILSRVAGFLEIPTPRCYLSHGLTGVQVLGRESDPFLMLGAAHFDEEHPQHMTLRQQTFAVASQLEHIRAGHLVLTSSEFWGAFRDRAFDGTIALLSLIPVGGTLGKYADSLAGTVFSKLRETFDNKAFKSAIEFGGKQLKGTAGDSLQSVYEATLSGLFALGKLDDRDEESLLKEQLADFARCAMYTADRVGLLVSDDLYEAVRAILLLSARTAQEIDALERDGLEGLLGKKNTRGDLAYDELAMRLGELFKFALSHDYLELRMQVFEMEDPA